MSKKTCDAIDVVINEAGYRTTPHYRSCHGSQVYECYHPRRVDVDVTWDVIENSDDDVYLSTVLRAISSALIDFDGDQLYVDPEFVRSRQTEFGEVFTPDFLVSTMLDLVDESIWSNPSSCFLEPSCGNGNFVVVIVQRKLDSGSTTRQALLTTFGVDIAPDNVEACRVRLKESFIDTSVGLDKEELCSIVLNNVVCCDFLSDSTRVDSLELFDNLSDNSKRDIAAAARSWMSGARVIPGQLQSIDNITSLFGL